MINLEFSDLENLAAANRLIDNAVHELYQINMNNDEVAKYCIGQILGITKLSIIDIIGEFKHE